jgi:hypothetical protein
MLREPVMRIDLQCILLVVVHRLKQVSRPADSFTVFEGDRCDSEPRIIAELCERIVAGSLPADPEAQAVGVRRFLNAVADGRQQLRISIRSDLNKNFIHEDDVVVA